MVSVINNSGNSSTSTQESGNPASGSSTPPAGAVPGRARVAIGFLTRDSDAELIVDCEHVVASMKGHPAFATLAPNVADVETSRTQFIAAVNAARDSRVAISARKQARAVLVGKMRDLANYVQVASGGDLPTLGSSGFPVRRARTPVGELPAPVRLRAVRGKVSGQIVARCGTVRQARAYQWRYAPAATPTAWSPVVTTFAASHTFAGLTPCTGYIVQVCAVGRAGPSDWSDAASVTVL
ncbi:MAG TPA: fibronectin type III domain-containing protein [Xanthomonadaceae bacterium]|nr:fibronectin type III domain-containing protein [Xanthomonadaceae bacterium]